MLQQTVLGYIASGWPREDIIIIDNSGTFDANNRGLLSKDNPFFLDYPLFRYRYGVSIQQTPTLLNFARLQNFILRMAFSRKWEYYFWSHMDVGILSKEEVTPYKSFYHRILEILAEEPGTKWAVKFFKFDNLVLANTDAWRTIGQWDVFIPYYATDCDAYGRFKMHGFARVVVSAGYIWDVADTVSNPEQKFFPSGSMLSHGNGSLEGHDVSNAPSISQDELNSARFQDLRKEFEEMRRSKMHNSAGRNTWQNRQKGGSGEPWTYHIIGFQQAWWDTAESGRKLYASKWGTRNCDLVSEGKGLLNIWEHAKDVSG